MQFLPDIMWPRIFAWTRVALAAAAISIGYLLLSPQPVLYPLPQRVQQLTFEPSLSQRCRNRRATRVVNLDAIGNRLLRPEIRAATIEDKEDFESVPVEL